MKYIFEMYRYENKVIYFNIANLLMVVGIIFILVSIPSIVKDPRLLVSIGVLQLGACQWIRTIFISTKINMNRIFLFSAQIELKYIIFKDLTHILVIFTLLTFSFFLFENGNYDDYNFIPNAMIMMVLFQSAHPSTLVNTYFGKENIGFQNRLKDFSSSMKALKYTLLTSFALLFISPLFILITLYSNLPFPQYVGLTYYIIANMVYLLTCLLILKISKRLEYS